MPDSEGLEIKYDTQAIHLQMSPQIEYFFPVTQFFLMIFCLFLGYYFSI